MWKPIAAGAAALLIAGSSVVYAQNQNRPGREGLRNSHARDVFRQRGRDTGGLLAQAAISAHPVDVEKPRRDP